MLRLVRFAIAKAGAFAVLFVIILGLIFGGLRLLLPGLASAYRDQLVQVIGARTGLQAQVDTMGLQLIGWLPRLTLEGVRLSDPRERTPLLSLRQISLDLDLLGSLASWTLVIEGATLEGARLGLRLRSDGSLVFSGLEGLHPEGSSTGLGFFLNEGRMVLQESELVWVNERFIAAPIHFVDLAVDLRNQGDRHQFAARGRLSAGQDAVLDVRGDLFSDPEMSAGLRGDVYAHLHGQDLLRLMGEQAGLVHALDAGAADVETWGGMEAGRLTSLVQRFQLQELRIVPPQGQTLNADRLEGLWRWRREAEGWALDVTDFTLVRDGHAWPLAHFSLWSGQGGDGADTMALGADFLDVADASAIARVLLVGHGNLVSMLEGMQPAGEARNLQWVARGADPRGTTWSFRGELTDLVTAPWHAWPGVRGLNAQVQADASGGVARLSSDDLQVRFPQLFRETLGANRLEGDFAWGLDAEGRTLELWSPDLELENADLATRSRLELRLPLDGDTPFLDIQTDFRDGNAAHTGRYLPVGIMPPAVVTWLDRAIVGGRVPGGTFLLRGPLAAFPYPERDGRFEVSFGVEDLILDYDPGWPRLEALGAEVRFLNQGLEIRASEGRILDSGIEGAEARIPDLAHHAPILEVSGVVAGPFADVLRILRESPLAYTSEGYVSGMSGQGESRVELELSLPLHTGASHRVAGSLAWNGDAALALDDWGLKLDQLTGRLQFGESSLSAQDLSARLWGQPVALDLAALESSGKKLTRVRARGRIGAETFAALHPSPLWKSFKGIPSWNLQLDIPHKVSGASGLPVHLTLESDLRGLEVSLPPPIRKPAAEKRRFTLSGDLAGGPNLDLEARYGDLWARLGLVRAASGAFRLVSGDIGSGSPKAQTLSEPGLRVNASLAELDLTQWLDWWMGPSTRSAGTRPELPLPLGNLDLRVNRLQLARVQCSDAHIRLDQDAETWTVSLSSAEIQGQVVSGQSGEKSVAVDVEKLDLKALLSGLKVSEPKREAALGAYPRPLPPLDVKIAKLAWGENPLGGVELHTRPVADGMEITELRASGPLLSIDGKGRWVRGEAGQRTSLELTGHSDDLGQLLRAVEFDSLLDRAPADASVALAWPDTPFSPAPGRFTGRVEFRVGAGSLLEVEPGFGRVLGILNLGALRRRLSLDFTDLFKQGYAFDGIEGTLDLRDGVARTEDLRIEGVSARVRVSGETDLASHEFDQLVTVIPDVSSGLVVAGAVAGGPLVGAAALLVDKVIGKQVDKLSQYQYRVTGPWENPVFERVNEAAGWSLGDLFPEEKGQSATKEGETKEPPNPFLNQ